MDLRQRKIFSDPNELPSQESKVTSTPRMNSPVFSLSPSISTIANEEVPMEIDSEISISNQHAIHSDNADSSLDEFSGSFRSLKRIKNVKWTQFWSSLKPKNRDSLYYKIMTSPAEIHNITIDLLNKYSKNNRDAIILILQLFVDLCGYKKLVLAKIYNFEEQNLKRIVEMMGSDLVETELKKTGKFVFMKSSRFAKLIEYILAEFLKHLVFTSFKTKVLFDEILTGHVLEFVNCMSFSSLNCIRITGVIIALKLLTAFINLYNQLQTTWRNESNAGEKVDEWETTIESFIDFLYIIYDKNCLLADKKCYFMKVMCAQEMFHWIILFPDIFIFKRRCLGRLMKLILDPNVVVRCNALTTCEKLICTESVREELKERIDLCLKVVSTRLLDTDYRVAIKAVSIFTAALDQYAENILKVHKLSILNRMYEKNILLAKAAGKFLAKYLHKQTKTDEQILISLTKIAFLKKELAERLPYFIESCVEFIPELKDWNAIIKVLLTDRLDFDSRVHLTEVFNECVRHSLTGKCSKSRQVASKNLSQSTDEHVHLANAIIPTFEDLMIKFQTNKSCLKHLIEILQFINYGCCRSDHLSHHYTTLFSLLKNFFEATTDKGLLENIINVFSGFCAQQYYNRAAVTVETIKNNIIKTLITDLKELSPSSERSKLISIREKSLKVSFLFTKFDLTNVLKWEDIFGVWDNNYLKVLKHLIVCCKWHLVWSLRHVIRLSTNGNNGCTNLRLYNNCKEFVYGCLDILKQAGDTSDSFLVFENLCDLYTTFEKELKRKRQFSTFVVKIVEPDCIDVLFNFVTRHVIENKTLHLDQRQKYLTKIVSVLYVEVLPVECFSKILQYYHSHFQEYGVIINGILNQLSLAHPALPFLVMHTLAEMYKKMLERQQTINIMTDEAKQLKSLAKRFTSAKVMTSNNDMLKLVNMTIYFALREEKNYQFLHFAKYFAKALNNSGKAEAHELLKSLVPEKAKKNDVFLLFAANLKSTK
ncbi:cohesin subunit SA-2-like isoform X2 [Tenebrio molitor]|uniref:cohesin subunit SA-2-like isoform X2 n=1 Tax=Tenebrio molitor TaxID=7067 RepID=UPI0036248B38